MLISKKLLFPKSPFELIFVNSPFLTFPINLKLLIFSDKGAAICENQFLYLY